MPHHAPTPNEQTFSPAVATAYHSVIPVGGSIRRHDGNGHRLLRRTLQIPPRACVARDPGLGCALPAASLNPRLPKPVPSPASRGPGGPDHRRHAGPTLQICAAEITPPSGADGWLFAARLDAAAMSARRTAAASTSVHLGGFRLSAGLEGLSQRGPGCGALLPAAAGTSLRGRR
jgi:hypothetical protein